MTCYPVCIPTLSRYEYFRNCVESLAWVGVNFANASLTPVRDCANRQNMGIVAELGTELLHSLYWLVICSRSDSKRLLRAKRLIRVV